MIKRKNKRAVAPLFILALILIGGAVLISSGMIDIGTIVGGNDFVKPLWARLECASSDSYDGKFSGAIPPANILNLNAKLLFKCDANTEECEITSNSKSGGFNYRLCDINGNNCGSANYIPGGIRILPSIESGKSYLFTSSLSGTTINAKWKTWKLYRFVGGAKYIVNSYNCDITSGDKSKIRQDDFKGDTLLRNGGEGTKWVNYVDDWAYGPGTNIVNYNGQEAYCSAGKVYSIVKLKMADGSLRKLDPTYKGKTSDNEVINGLGSVIANVECCPNEPNCGNDFKYKKTEVIAPTKECFSDIQCYNSNGPVPISNYQYIKYSCVDNFCKKSDPMTVECTTNAACKNGEICDLSTMNYGKCIKQISGEYCGDGICQITENHDKCSKDCEFTCAPGETLITEQSNKGLFCFYGYGLCEKSDLKYCSKENNKFDWNKLIFWIIIVIVVILLIRFFPVIRAIFKSIPFISRYIP